MSTAHRTLWVAAIALLSQVGVGCLALQRAPRVGGPEETRAEGLPIGSISGRIAQKTTYRRTEAGFSPQEAAIIGKNCGSFSMPQTHPGWDHGPTKFVVRRGYALQHGSIEKNPLWVCEGLTEAQVTGDAIRRSNSELDWIAQADTSKDPNAGAAKTAPAAKNCRPRQECCKVCSKGQACGASCISASYTCHKGRGCACNESEICR